MFYKILFYYRLKYLNVNHNGIKDIKIVPTSFASLEHLMISDNDLLHVRQMYA